MRGSFAPIHAGYFGRFFWIDAPLSEATADDLGDVLDVPTDTLQALLSFGEDLGSSRSSTPMGYTSACCQLLSRVAQLADEGPYRLDPGFATRLPTLGCTSRRWA